MSLADIASIATIVSGIAVPITLIFLAVQVRQGEKNQRAQMQQGRADRIGSQALDVASDAELAHVFNVGMFAPEKLTREQFERFLLIGRALFISNEDSFLQFKAGMLDRTSYETQIAGLRRMVTIWPGVRALWRLMSAQHGDAYRTH